MSRAKIIEYSNLNRIKRFTQNPKLKVPPKIHQR